MTLRSLMFTLLLLTPLAQASDLVREGRIAAQIREAILDGAPMTLTADGVEFFAIDMPAETDEVRGAVILIHGRGANPDWADVIQPLRTRLPAHGWQTLSLQMPVAAVDAPSGSYAELIPEAFPRIDAAVEWLLAQGVTRIAVVAHSLGARMAIEYLVSKEPAKEIVAFAAVGLSANTDEPQTGVLDALSRIKMPILDLYGERDLPSVRGSAKARALAARKAQNPDYQQVKVPLANHFFTDLEDDLVPRVRAWISRVADNLQ